eukprot:scaffold25_cov342-Pavlova_lutheri.AAC.49
MAHSSSRLAHHVLAFLWHLHKICEVLAGFSGTAKMSEGHAPAMYPACPTTTLGGSIVPLTFGATQMVTLLFVIADIN